MTLKILNSHLGSHDVMLMLTNGADVTVMLEMGNDKNASLMAILWRSYSPSYHGNHKLYIPSSISAGLCLIPRATVLQ